MVGKFDERDRRERDKELRQLRRELCRLWHQRQQDQAGETPADDTQAGPSESPDA